MAKTRVALEITEESVRAVELTTGRVPSLVAAGEVALPEGAAKDSEILDRDAVAVALQRLWAEARISSRDVVLGVGNRRILVREHSTQLTNPVHIRESLPFEVQDRLPVPVDQAVLDFVPTAQDERGVHGLLVAAVAEHMEELVGALKQAKLRATSIDLMAFGYARALATLTGPGRTGLFVGIGEHTTQIVIATGGIPRFVRVVPIDIVARAAEGEEEPGMSTSAAPPVDQVESPAVSPPATGDGPGPRRRGRAAVALPPAETPEPSLHPAVQASLIDLVGRLRGTVNFYRDRPDALPIEAAWVAGAHAAHPRLLEAIGRVTETPVTPISVIDLVRPARPLPIHADTGARLAGTVSLLLEGPR